MLFKKHKKPWHESRAGGFKLCEAYGMTARLLPTKFDAYIFEGEMPMRRFLALQGAVKAASFGVKPEELTELLLGVYEEAHKEKNILTLRQRLQTSIDNIIQRTQRTDEELLTAICLPCMVLEGENPFLYDTAHDEAKKTILAGVEAEAFFLSKAKNMLSGFLSA